MKGKFWVLYVHTWHDSHCATKGSSKEGEIETETHIAHDMQIIFRSPIFNHLCLTYVCMTAWKIEVSCCFDSS